VAEIERSRELGSSQSERPSIGYLKSRRREVASSESAIKSYRRFGASAVGSPKPRKDLRRRSEKDLTVGFF
jgi:hypothetical protein